MANSCSDILGKDEKDQLCTELKNCLDIMEPIEGKPMDEVVIFTFLLCYLTSPLINILCVSNLQLIF